MEGPRVAQSHHNRPHHHHHLPHHPHLHDQQVVQEALEVAQQGRTSITIAHRLSTIASADQIYVIEKGEVVESGTHEDLINRRAIYAKLWNNSAH